jgi:hypothetical protein
VAEKNILFWKGHNSSCDCRLLTPIVLPKINAEIFIVIPLNIIGSIYVKKLTLSNDNITLKNKIVFTAVLIFLIAVIAYLIQQHYFESYRDSLTKVDFLTLLTEINFDFHMTGL